MRVKKDHFHRLGRRLRHRRLRFAITLEPTTKNQEPTEPRTKNPQPQPEPRTKNQEPRTKNQEPELTTHQLSDRAFDVGLSHQVFADQHGLDALFL